jgi:hypothetical protein
MADRPAAKSNNIKQEKDCEKNLISFAQILDSFAATLPKAERLILVDLILNSMDPVERMKWRSVTSLLKPEEIEILNKLQGEATQQ